MKALKPQHFTERSKKIVAAVRLVQNEHKDTNVRMHVQTIEVSMPEELGIDINLVAQELGLSRSQIWEYLCKYGGYCAAYGLEAFADTEKQNIEFIGQVTKEAPVKKSTTKTSVRKGAKSGSKTTKTSTRKSRKQ